MSTFAAHSSGPTAHHARNTSFRPHLHHRPSMSHNPPKPNPCDITILETEDGRARVEVRFERENVWLTQKLMADLYECSTDNISLHFANSYADRELDPAATAEESSAVQTEGNREARRRVTLCERPQKLQERRCRQMKSFSMKTQAGIRTRKSPSADEEIGHRAACIGHLINIADLTGRSLKWDPVKEAFAGCDAANRLRSRAMRAPWRM